MNTIAFKIIALTVLFSISSLPSFAKYNPELKLIDQAVEDMKILSADDMQGRKTGTAGSENARNYLLARMKTIGLETYKGKFEHSFTFKPASPKGDGENLEGINLLAKIKGESSDHMMVISAHYDHLGTRGDEIFNGADDNASGVSALLAVAESMMDNPPAYDVVFALFDAEEMGLQGAKAFVKSLEHDEQTVTLNMNMDMVATNDKNELYAVGTYHTGKLIPIVQALESKVSVKLLMGHDLPGTGKDDWTFGSDHGAFHAAKIPFLYFGVEDHADYHKPTDNFSTVREDFYRRAVQSLIICAYEINEALPKV